MELTAFELLSNCSPTSMRGSMARDIGGSFHKCDGYERTA